MKYDLHKPCQGCPFRRGAKAVRVTPERAEEIAEMMLDSKGGEFPCHMTTVDDDEGDRRATKNSKHCAGALIFAEKNQTATQMMRICERIGMYDRTKLLDQDQIFDDIDELMDAHADFYSPRNGTL